MQNTSPPENVGPAHEPVGSGARPTAIVVHASERPEGTAALTWALQHARGQNPHRAGATTVHVVLSHNDREGSATFYSPAALEAVHEQLRGSELPYQVHEPSDDPAGQVIDLADDLHAHLVVTGVARRSATMKLIMGSHTQRILLGAPCPVVAVKN